MANRDELARLERQLAVALVAGDPDGMVEVQQGLPVDLRQGISCIDADGFRIAAVLVAKLRFQRLMSGCKLAGDWFERDAEEFAAAFRSYHIEVPCTAIDPWAEALAFTAWNCESS